MNLTDVFLMSKRSLMERLFDASVHMIYSAASLEDVKVGRSKSNTEDNHPTFILFVRRQRRGLF
jgi:hypothetical protein